MPKIFNDITNILAKLASSPNYDPRVKYDTALEYYGNQIPVLPKPAAGDANKTVSVKADLTYELKNPSANDTNAVHYSEDSDKTDAQKTQARANIEAEPEKFIITVTESGGVYSADKSYTEIAAAYNDGKTCEVICNGIYTLVYPGFDADWCCFSRIAYFVGLPFVEYLELSSDGEVDEWTYLHTNLQIGEQSLVVSGTTPTIAFASDNTIYNCGELTSLTVTAITSNGDFIIRFTSGSTPTTTDFPATMIFPEAFSAEANTRYEINVSKGYALAVGWPVSSS